MTAKEYLNQAAELKRRIRQEEDRIKFIRSEMESPRPIRYDKDMIQKSASGDAMERYMIKLEKEEKRLLKLKEKHIDTFHRIRQRIMHVQPSLYADVLYMRYLEGKTIGVIANEMHYSYEWTCKIHGRALQDFSRRNPDI